MMLGFIWNSLQQTRQLTKPRRERYVADWKSHAAMKALPLKVRQSDIGRLHRAVSTLPAGAGIYLANILMAIRGLTLPWQKRRVSKSEKSDLLSVASLLEANLGKGYYSWRTLGRAPALYTDASKKQGYAGGGYVSMCGAYSWHRYSSRAARKPIDFLEGDTLLAALEGIAGRHHRLSAELQSLLCTCIH